MLIRGGSRKTGGLPVRKAALIVSNEEGFHAQIFS